RRQERWLEWDVVDPAHGDEVDEDGNARQSSPEPGRPVRGSAQLFEEPLPHQWQAEGDPPETVEDGGSKPSTRGGLGDDDGNRLRDDGLGAEEKSGSRA